MLLAEQETRRRPLAQSLVSKQQPRRQTTASYFSKARQQRKLVYFSLFFGGWEGEGVPLLPAGGFDLFDTLEAAGDHHFKAVDSLYYCSYNDK